MTIPDDEQDKHLEDKLVAEELPEILNWALLGCQWWQADGLGIPEEVGEATRAYRDDSDPLGQFVADGCVVGERHEVSVAKLWTAYCEWAAAANERPLNKRGFGARMDERGFPSHKVAGTMVRSGIEMQSDPDQELPIE